MSSSHLLSYGDCLLDKEDLNILQKNDWINDKLINFAFEYTMDTDILNHKDEICMCCAEVVQLMKMCESGEELRAIFESLNLPSKKWIFLPINDNESRDATGGSHWSILVYEASTQTFLHYDSLDQSNYPSALQIAKQLTQLLDAKLKIVKADSPKQENGYDCGVYVMEIARALVGRILKGESLHASPDGLANIDISQSRQYWSNVITSLAGKQHG